MGGKEKRGMSSISYLFGKTELRCLMKLLGYGSVPEWSRQEKAILSAMEQKGYLTERGGTIYVEPLIKLFADVMGKPDRALQLSEGKLYRKKDIFLWCIPDDRKLDGVVIRAYPSVTRWYEDEKETLEHPFDYYVGEITKNG